MDRSVAQMLILLAQNKINTKAKAVSINELLQLVEMQTDNKYVVKSSVQQIKRRIKQLIKSGTLEYGLKSGNQKTYYITTYGIKEIREVANAK